MLKINVKNITEFKVKVKNEQYFYLLFRVG